ncbi:MAG TPA: hypothetical protein VG693_04100 [Actinomycetes bacterium]|nr:hypothetical protein [Actinomycetes bacterium]
MRTFTRASLAGAVAAGAAVAVLALWNPAATAGDGGGTGRPEPAPQVVAGYGGDDRGSVPPAGGGAADVPAVTEPVAPSAPVARATQSKDPDTSVSSPALPYDPGYWTPERMASAKPMPMPSPG